MNRYFFSQRNDDNFNKIGLTYAPNRYVAAQLFAIRKGKLDLKDFLNIYAIHNFTKIKIGKSLKIRYKNLHSIYHFKNGFYECDSILHNLKQKYTLNKFLQLLNYLEKEECYILSQD